MKNHPLRLMLAPFWGLAGLLLLSACSFPRAASAPPQIRDDIPVFVPDSGGLMSWWDGSSAVYVPGGEFVMGDQNASSGDNVPAHTVSLESFWIQKYEVTNRMYARCAAAGQCQPPNDGLPEQYAGAAYANYPVVGVRWQDADAYCKWIGGGLPSEAQWELAARGAEGKPYPWGEDGPSCSLLNYEGCAMPPVLSLIGSHAAGDSPYGVSDMAGNAAEWVGDWFAPDYYAASPAQNPGGPSNGDFRVVRGGSYLSRANALFVHQRTYAAPGSARPDLGFRCVIGADKENAGGQIAPMCEAAPFVPIHQEIPQPGVPALPAPLISVDVSCMSGFTPGSVMGTAVVNFVGGGPITQITSPQGDLACSEDPALPGAHNCFGSALQPGQSVTIIACNALQQGFPAYQVQCPNYYYFNENKGICRYDFDASSCPLGSVTVIGYGCIPLMENGACPAGHYEATYEKTPVCIPAGGPQCLPGMGCAATCPPGLFFNAEQVCCDYPEDLPPDCPAGSIYVAQHHACISQVQAAPGCTTVTKTVPDCSGIQPPSVPGQTEVKCNQITSKNSCENKGCEWVKVTDTAGYCTP